MEAMGMVLLSYFPDQDIGRFSKQSQSFDVAHRIMITS